MIIPLYLDDLGFKTHLPVNSPHRHLPRRLSDQRREETWHEINGLVSWGRSTPETMDFPVKYGKHRGLSGDMFPLNLNQHLKLTLMVIFLIHWVKYTSDMLNCSSISIFWTTKLVVILLCWISQSWTRDEPTKNVLSEQVFDAEQRNVLCFEMWDDGLGITDIYPLVN